MYINWNKSLSRKGI